MTYGGFHKWGYPKMDGVFQGKVKSKMDRGTPILGNPHLSYPLVNVNKKLWKDPPFCSWVNQRTFYGHVQVRKLFDKTRLIIH